MATENGAAELEIPSSSTGAMWGQRWREELGKGCLNPELGQCSGFKVGVLCPRLLCVAHGGPKNQNYLWIGWDWVKGPQEDFPRETGKM